MEFPVLKNVTKILYLHAGYMAQILGKKSIAVLVNDTCITSSSTIDR